MKRTLLLVSVLISSGMGYLEWGGGNHAFIFQAEWTFITRLWRDPLSALHPFTVLPFTGQLILGVALFSKCLNRWWIVAGVGLIAVLYLMILVVGIVSAHSGIIVSALPFLVLGTLTVFLLFKKQKTPN